MHSNVIFIIPAAGVGRRMRKGKAINFFFFNFFIFSSLHFNLKVGGIFLQETDKGIFSYSLKIFWDGICVIA